MLIKKTQKLKKKKKKSNPNRSCPSLRGEKEMMTKKAWEGERTIVKQSSFGEFGIWGRRWGDGCARFWRAKSQPCVGSVADDSLELVGV